MMTLNELQNATMEQITDAFSGSYDDMLDDVQGEDIHIGYSVFTASAILKELDPITYEQGLYEYALSQVEDNEG